ncbi:MAG: thiamine-phosphate kinase [Bacteroidales bacterium]|nr:thiamine-phosphate kinase [Bacteroidales bacterium]
MEFENKENRTEIGSLGEFGLIKHLTEKIIIKNKTTIKGIGDDSAVIDFSKNKTLISTDVLVEGIHFDLSYTPLKHLGYKAAVVNFSDIAAMNAKPSQLLVSIALSNRFSLEAVEEIYAGIYMACEKYNVDLVGGDTSSSERGLFICPTVIGEADEKEITYRNTAKPNDLICVSGDLGGAYMGLQVLEREKSVFKVNPKSQPDLTGYDYILERQLKPEARTDIVDLLKDLKVKPTSMIDVSDGLASELLHICTGSNVGCSIYDEKIPIDEKTFNTALEFKMDPTVCALSGGEDYELLFTVDISDFEKIKGIRELTIIGHVTEKESGINIISRNGTQNPITAQGWDSILKKE